MLKIKLCFNTTLNNSGINRSLFVFGVHGFLLKLVQIEFVLLSVEYDVLPFIVSNNFKINFRKLLLWSDFKNVPIFEF